MVGFVALAVALRQRADERRREEEARREQERLRQEKARRDHLVASSESWTEAERIRRLVAAVERRATAGDAGISADVAARTRWAQQVANDLDPLPASIHCCAGMTQRRKPLAGLRRMASDPHAQCARLSLGHLERRAVFRPRAAVIVDARGRDVGVAEPFLHLGDVGLVVERVGRGRRLQSIGADLKAELLRIGPYQVVDTVGSSRVDLQACKLEYSIVSPK